MEEDKLDHIDWNRAISAAWFGHRTLPEAAFEDSFNEVLLLLTFANLSPICMMI